MDSQRVVFMAMEGRMAHAALGAVGARHRVVGVVESLLAARAPADLSSVRSGLRRWAVGRGVPYLAVAKGRERPLKFLEEARADIICVAGMELLLRPEEWSAARLGAINLHPSLLPAYRGPAPLFWQCQRMELAGGVTVHRIDAGIDTGNILVQERFAIELGATQKRVELSCAEAGARAMMRGLQMVAMGEVGHPQLPLDCPFYAKKVKREDLVVPWEDWPLERVWHFLRGTQVEYRTLAMLPGMKGRWEIGRMERGSLGGKEGEIGWDRRGSFVQHREGRILLGWVRERGLLRRLAHWCRESWRL